jgi:hypothetical protein
MAGVGRFTLRLGLVAICLQGVNALGLPPGQAGGSSVVTTANRSSQGSPDAFGVPVEYARLAILGRDAEQHAAEDKTKHPSGHRSHSPKQTCLTRAKLRF